MALSIDTSYLILDQYSSSGFNAGVTIKGPWEKHDDIYKYIHQNLVPRELKLIIPKQVHGADIINLDNSSMEVDFEADGIITKRNDLCLTITTADCLPMIFADPKSGYFAAIHIGWRCFIAGIVENFTQIVRDLNIDLKKSMIFLGPGIGNCCFEVGPEVSSLFEDCYVTRLTGKFYIDLREAVRNKLISLGVVNSNLSSLSDCTSCDSDRYYSYRRDKDTPVQMVTFIFKSNI